MSIPQFWQIERNSDNYEVINEWMNEHHGKLDKYDYRYYTDVCGWVNNKNLYKSRQRGLPTIDFEQFQKFILDKEKDYIPLIFN